jgi:two-component system chemotaxis response regulator CheY
MILIIDDDVSLGTSLEKFFRYAGLDTVSVTSGMEALNLMSARVPALIIMDLNMPLLDGMMMLQAIRKDAAFAKVPILIFTADISREKEMATLKAGAQAYIVKGTVSWNMLLEKVRDLID